MHYKVELSSQLEDKMMAAKFLLRRAVPALKQVRSYAEAAAVGSSQMSFTFASPSEVQTLRRLGLTSLHTPEESVTFTYSHYSVKHCKLHTTCL